MIDPKMIPPDVVEAAARAIGEETYVGNKQTLRDAATAAILAALEAWPGMWTSASVGNGSIILPITETDDDK